jgi:hypothetical protein
LVIDIWSSLGRATGPLQDEFTSRQQIAHPALEN